MPQSVKEALDGLSPEAISRLKYANQFEISHIEKTSDGRFVGVHVPPAKLAGMHVEATAGHWCSGQIEKKNVS